MAWGTMVGRFDHTRVRACFVFFFTARIPFLTIHCSTPPSWIYGRFLHSYSSLSQSTLLLFQFLSLSPPCARMGQVHQVSHAIQNENPIMPHITLKRLRDTWSLYAGTDLSRTVCVQPARARAHLIFSLCQVSPSLKQPNFWFSFMQSTLLSMLRCPILVPFSRHGLSEVRRCKSGCKHKYKLLRHVERKWGQKRW